MLKKYSFVLVLMLIVSPIMAQNIPSYVPKDGLLGYWPFNGNANDESGKANHGKVNGASLTKDRNGKANSAYSFDNSNITVSIQNKLFQNDFTISGWVYLDSASRQTNYPTFITQQNSYLTIQVEIWPLGNTPTFLSYFLDNYNIPGVQKEDGHVKAVTNFNAWHFFVLRNSNKVNYLYIDGKLISTSSSPSALQGVGKGDFLLLGSGDFLPAEYFNGKLDDITIFNRSITESEIQALYEGNACPLKASISPQGSVKICEGSSIVLQSADSTHAYQWFKDNQPIAGATSKSYTATKAGKYTLKVSDPICTSVSSVTTVDTILLPSAPSFSSTFQKICGMESIEMISQRLINYNSAINLKWYRNETGHDSISKYMSLDPYPRNYYVSQISATSPKCESVKRTMVFMDVNMPVSVNAKGNTTFCKGDSVVLEASAANGNQYDYAWKKDYNWIAGTEGKNTFVAKESGRYSYQNRMCGMQMNGNEIEVFVKQGLKVNVGKITGSSVEFVWDTLSLSPMPKDFVISYGINSTSLTQTISIPVTTSYVFTGLNKGDTVRVSISPKGTDCTTPSFASAVTREIVIPNNIPTNGLVAFWPFNGNANDESGHGNHGTVNEVTLTVDRNGTANSAYRFDGLKSFITILFSDKLYSSIGTINCWIKTDGVFNEQKLIFGQSWGRPQLVANPDNIGNNHTVAIQWKDKEGNFPFTSSNSQVDKSEWIMVTGIYSPTGFKILINGVLENVSNVSKIQDNNKFDFQIGGFNILENGYSYQQMFKGQIDDISLYNRALSEQEVKQLYGVSCPKETATSSSFNSLLLSSGSSVSISAEPKGGVFKSTSVEQNQFLPSKAKIGMNKVQYNFKNSQGCNDSTLFTMIVADTVGTHCKKYDTITVIKYDTISLTDTVSILKIKFNLTTGLQANKMASMSVYPNPTTDVLHIEVGDAKALEGYRYRIVDALGKEVYNELVKNAITGIPMKTLGAAGMYQFEVLDQKNVRIQTNKIVLE